MGSGHDWCGSWLPGSGGVGHGGDHVAYAVGGHIEAEIFHPGDHEITAGLVFVGECQSTTSRVFVRARGAFGDIEDAKCGQGLDSGHKPSNVNGQHNDESSDP